jgi:hypothetical protein
MEPLYYCWKWSRYNKIPLDMFSTEKAQSAYNSRSLYTVLVGDEHRPRCFVESNADYVGLEFLDERLRSYVCYTFQKKSRGKLFLSMAIMRQFRFDCDEV